MTRSLTKGSFIDSSLLKHLHKNKEVIRVYSRRSTIFPFFMDKVAKIHNGKDFISIKITSDMIGHKFGEFAYTRARTRFSDKKKK
jgi:small subunit ribosomal protein S19